jgi:hypothetical protein
MFTLSKAGLNWFRKFLKRCFKNQTSVIWSFIICIGTIICILKAFTLHLRGEDHDGIVTHGRLQGKHLPFSPSPLRLNISRLFVILSLTQLYRYTPEIFLFATATFKYTYLYIWEEKIMMALLHMAGLENSECIWKIQHKPEVVVSVSMT